MKKIFAIFYSVLLVLAPQALLAQDMATAMRNDGKIYVVVAVLATIFVGIFAFLIYLEKRVQKLEKDSDTNFKN